jgi:hypothetical protein
MTLAVYIAGYSSLAVRCDSSALVPVDGEEGAGSCRLRSVALDTIKQHVSAHGWRHGFSHAVDFGTAFVADWPLHLLRPFGMCVGVALNSYLEFVPDARCSCCAV